MKILILLLLVSCASQPIVLTKQEKSVRVLLKSDAPEKCSEIKQVFATGNLWTGQVDRNNIKRIVASVGGDLFVKTNDLDGAPGSVYGFAYKCK